MSCRRTSEWRVPECATSSLNLWGSRNVGGDLPREQEQGRGDRDEDPPQERDDELGEGEGETWDIAMRVTNRGSRRANAQLQLTKLTGNAVPKIGG